MAVTVTIHQAKTQLSRLIARAEAGEEIVIARGDKPVVRLALLKADKKKIRPKAGMLKGLNIPDSFFFDPLPEEELKLWDGSDDDPFR